MCYPEVKYPLLMAYFCRDHLKNVHRMTRIPYTALVNCVGSTTKLRLPTMNSRQTAFPLLKLMTGVKCSLGHVNYRSHRSRVKQCRTRGCAQTNLIPISVQKIGRKIIEITGDAPHNNPPSFTPITVAEIHAIENMDTDLPTGRTGTRASRQIDTMYNLAIIFPSPPWDDALHAELKAIQCESHIYEALLEICSETKDRLYGADLFRQQ